MSRLQEYMEGASFKVVAGRFFTVTNHTDYHIVVERPEAGTRPAIAATCTDSEMADLVRDALHEKYNKER